MPANHQQQNQDQAREDRELGHWSTRAGQFLVRCISPLARWLGPAGALMLILLVGGGTAAALAAASAGIHQAVVSATGVATLDQPVLDFAVSVRRDWLDGLVVGFTDLGGPIGMSILSISVMVLLAVRRRSWTPLILMPAAAAGSLAMTIAGKDMIGRLRPPLELAIPPYESSPSFPSGHSLNALVLAGIVAYLLVIRRHRTSARILTVLLAALFAGAMGLTRVYLGHHWLTDVLVAWTLGVAWLAVVITAHRLFLTFRQQPDAGHQSAASGTRSAAVEY